MKGGTVSKTRAFAIGGPIIAAMVLGLFAASYLISTLLRFPSSLRLPVAAGPVGGILVVVGSGFIAWTFSNRNPIDVIASTYVTLAKALRRISASEGAGRTEPLNVSGPQKYTRNPLYFGVIVTILGFALLTALSYFFVAVLVFLSWFSLVIIPLEERELRALFGDQWTKYSESTSMLIPFAKRRKPQLTR